MMMIDRYRNEVFEYEREIRILNDELKDTNQYLKIRRDETMKLRRNKRNVWALFGLWLLIWMFVMTIVFIFI